MSSKYRFTRSLVFFFNDTATTEIYTLSLHDALPISYGSRRSAERKQPGAVWSVHYGRSHQHGIDSHTRSEEHTSELQSRQYLVCRLLLEKKKQESARSVSAWLMLTVLPSPLTFGK